ncbi:uncharacterized protein LOC120347780 isoform X2 [Styela clava]
MDFGSSHVYAGAPYYSDVPIDNVPQVQNDQHETIYEAVEIEHGRHQEYSETSSDQHSYDPVCFDQQESDDQINSRIHASREYDLVPYEPNLDSVNNNQPPNIVTKPAAPKRSLSSTVLHKAMKVKNWKNKKNKPMKSDSSVPDATTPVVPPPLPPPRPTRIDKPLPPVPTEVRSTNSGPPELPPPRIPPKPEIYQTVRAKPPEKPLPKTVLAIDEIVTMLSSNTMESNCGPVPLKPTVVTSKPLYPVLPNVYGDINLNPIKATTAPLTTASFKAQSLPLQPSAPPLSSSQSNKSLSKNHQNTYSAADTNIVSVKLGILENTANSMVWAMPPMRCQKCQAVLLHHVLAKNKEVADCQFCESKNANITEAILPLVGNESDVTFVLDQQAPMASDDPIIVFCIDTSGSMCVTSQVQGNNSSFMSRLRGVQEGLLSQLHQLKATRPKVRVAIVTFSSMVSMYGDGSSSQYMTLSDAQLYDTDFIKHMANSVLLPGCISNTHAQLLNTVNMLTERGGTALGPAILFSVALASRKSSSQVIVCTDGRANIGVGSLELESDYKMCHNFYKEVSEYGTMSGTVVSILSIEGTDCRLVELGKVADRTAGKVKIANSQNISTEFHDILSSSLMATQVSINMVTQKELHFHDGMSQCNSLAKYFVGNATQDTEVTFKYGMAENDHPPPESAMFQLQAKYLLPNGCTCLRVITQSRPVTENRILAEHGLNPVVVGTYASQLASKLVFDGDLRDAKLTTDAHKKLIHRAMSIRSTYSTRGESEYNEAADERIYGTVCSHIDELDKEIIEQVTGSVKASGEKPPPLPPRPPDSPSILHRSPSLLLPDVPNTPLPSREELKEAVEHCPDEVARKLYKHRNACGKMFSAC